VQFGRILSHPFCSGIIGLFYFIWQKKLALASRDHGFLKVGRFHHELAELREAHEFLAILFVSFVNSCHS